MIRSQSLVTINEPLGMATECYKMFRTNLNYLNVDYKKQVLLFTSSFTEEGKTTSVVNTAITYAQADKKVLVIDGDLRKSRIHKLFDIPQTPGLTNCLADGKGIGKVVQKIEEVPNLHVLTAGAIPPNPAELLGSQRMLDLLQEVRGLYDVIIIDAPPVLSVADAMVLSKEVDGVILVVAAHITKIDELKKAKKALDHVGAPLLGALMTKSEIKNKKYYAYYGGDKK